MSPALPKKHEGDFLEALPSPARRALVGAGFVRLEQLSQVSEVELLRLHGLGPKAIEILRRQLQARRLSFARR